MFTLYQYLFRQLALAFAVVVIGLTAAVWLTQSLRFIEIVLNQGFPLKTFFELVVLMIPDLVTIVMPISLFVSILFVYHKLIQDSEMIVMRSTGFSDPQLAIPGFLLGGIVMAIMFWVNIEILPTTFKKFRDMEHEIKNGIASIFFNEGEFSKFGDVTVYVRDKKGTKSLKGIFIHDARNPKDPYVLMASYGGIVQEEEGAKILLYGGSRQSLPPRDRDPSKTYEPSNLSFENYLFEFKPSDKGPQVRTKKPFEMTLTEQLFPAPGTSSEDVIKLRKEGHQKLIWPLFAPILTLVALAFLLKDKSHRRTRPHHLGKAIAIALLVQGITFGLLQWGGWYGIGIYLGYGLLLGVGFLCGRRIFEADAYPQANTGGVS